MKQKALTLKQKEQLAAKLLTEKPATKRINTNAKGRRSEKKTEKWLEERGWVVDTTRRSSYRGGSNDFFGLFDHVAVCATDMTSINGNETPAKKRRVASSFFEGTVLFVQTKSNRVTKEVMDKIADFPARNKAIFIWHDNKEEPEIRLSLERNNHIFG